MPTIPVYTAEGARQPTPSSPSRISGFNLPSIPRITLPPPVPLVVGEAAENLAKAAVSSLQHFARLAAQKDEADYLAARGQFEGQLESMATDLARDPTILDRPDGYLNEFTKRTGVIIDTINKDKRFGDYGKRLFGNYVAEKLPKKLAEAKGVGLKIFTKNELDKFKVSRSLLSKQAAEATYGADRDDLVRTFYAYTDNTVKRGLMLPAEGAAEKIQFRKDVMAKSMDVLRVRDRMGFWDRMIRGEFAEVDPVEQHKALEAARRDQDDDDRRAKEIADERKKQVMNLAVGNANYGNLPQAWLDNATAGHNPHVTAQQGRELQAWNDNPIAGGDSLSIRALAQEYHGGERTVERVQRYREKANKLGLSIGRPVPLLDKLLNELQNDEDAARRINISEIELKTKQALDAYEAMQPIFGLSPALRFQYNQRAIDQAEIRSRIWHGADPEQVLKEMRDRATNKEQKKTPSEKRIDDATKEIQKGRTMPAVPTQPGPKVTPRNKIEEYLR